MVSLTFSQNFFEHNVSYSKNYCDLWRIFVSKVTLIALWRYQWRFRRAFSNKMSPYSSNYCDFQRFLLFRNKARNAGRSGKNAGMREISQNAGFPARLWDGWRQCFTVPGSSLQIVTGRWWTLSRITSQGRCPAPKVTVTRRPRWASLAWPSVSTTWRSTAPTTGAILTTLIRSYSRRSWRNNSGGGQVGARRKGGRGKRGGRIRRCWGSPIAGRMEGRKCDTEVHILSV